VANGAGLDLLRADRSPLAERVIALNERHPNVKLIACNLTMDRLRRRGETVALLPGVQVVPSALDEIVDRLNSGWLYVRS
jgi:intracellular sulfur oxidation DsrE/DsrF family protein